jgi:hypothetical protein
MRNLVSLASLLAGFVISSPVNSDAPTDAFNECRGVVMVATDIMTARQTGVSMMQMMEAAQDMGEFKAGTEQLIRLAYDEPRMHTEAAQRRSVTEFANRMLSLCMDVKDPR